MRTILNMPFPILMALIIVIKKMLRKPRLPLPPGPKPWPVIGCLPEILRNQPFRWIHRLMEEMGIEIACIRVGGVHIIVVTSPEIAREILKTQDACFLSRPLCMAADLTTYGYLGTTLSPVGDQWKKMRRILVSEVLCKSRHHWFEDKRFEEADHVIRYVFNQCRALGGVVNVRNIARHYSGNVIRRLTFNKRFFGKGRGNGGPGVEEEEHVDALFTTVGHIYSFCVSDYMPWLKPFDVDGHEKSIRQALRTVAKYHDPEIHDRVQQWRDGIKKKQEDMLDFFITSEDKEGKPLLTTEEIKAQIIDNMFVALDNTSNIVEWVLAEMLNEPKLLNAALEEIDSVVGRERLVQESDMPRLNLIKACAKEALRVHPVTAFNITHLSIADTNVAGYFIPKGSHVLVSRLGLGRNPRVWEEPLRFKPERHLKKDGSEVVLLDKDLRMISFGAGRRGCPGANLGSAMTIMLLARLVQGFTWSLPPGVRTVDLEESKCNLFLAKPLLAHARPRLPSRLYV